VALVNMIRKFQVALGGKLFEQLNDYELLRKASILWS
jgi:hypothetical protein